MAYQIKDYASAQLYDKIQYKILFNIIEILSFLSPSC